MIYIYIYMYIWHVYTACRRRRVRSAPKDQPGCLPLHKHPRCVRTFETERAVFSTKRSSFDCQDRLGTSISKSRNKRFKLGSLFFAGADCSLAEFCDVIAEAGELKR